jgi:hypothetical protein
VPCSLYVKLRFGEMYRIHLQDRKLAEQEGRVQQVARLMGKESRKKYEYENLSRCSQIPCDLTCDRTRGGNRRPPVSTTAPHNKKQEQIDLNDSDDRHTQNDRAS